MPEPEKPAVPKVDSQESATTLGKVVPLRRTFPPEQQPARLNDADALKVVRMIAADSGNIVVIRHGRSRSKLRSITRPQIERCVQKGTITEGPFLNQHGNWQMNLLRHSAGEQITCTVAIEWATRVLVITAF
jgi:hypothetical protein